MNNPFDDLAAGGAPGGDFAPPTYTPPAAVPAEHQTVAPKGAVPSTTTYEGGGIFAQATPGPSIDTTKSQQNSPPPPRGYNFGPSEVPLPAVAPMPGMPGPPLRVQPAPARYPMDDLGDYEENMVGHNLGLSVIGVAGGAAVGTYYGGPFGGLAGGLAAGAAVNAYRAMKYFTSGGDDREAKISGTYAVVSAVGAGALWYYFVSDRDMKKNAESKRTATRGGRRSYKEFSQNAPEDCDIRPVGP